MTGRFERPSQLPEVLVTDDKTPLGVFIKRGMDDVRDYIANLSNSPEPVRGDFNPRILDGISRSMGGNEQSRVEAEDPVEDLLTKLLGDLPVVQGYVETACILGQTRSEFTELEEVVNKYFKRVDQVKNLTVGSPIKEYREVLMDLHQADLISLVRWAAYYKTGDEKEIVEPFPPHFTTRTRKSERIKFAVDAAHLVAREFAFDQAEERLKYCINGIDNERVSANHGNAASELTYNIVLRAVEIYLATSVNEIHKRLKKNSDTLDRINAGSELTEENRNQLRTLFKHLQTNSEILRLLAPGNPKANSPEFDRLKGRYIGQVIDLAKTVKPLFTEYSLEWQLLESIEVDYDEYLSSRAAKLSEKEVVERNAPMAEYVGEMLYQTMDPQIIWAYANKMHGTKPDNFTLHIPYPQEALRVSDMPGFKLFTELLVLVDEIWPRLQDMKLRAQRGETLTADEIEIATVIREQILQEMEPKYKNLTKQEQEQYRNRARREMNFAISKILEKLEERVFEPGLLVDIFNDLEAHRGLDVNEVEDLLRFAQVPWFYQTIAASVLREKFERQDPDYMAKYGSEQMGPRSLSVLKNHLISASAFLTNLDEFLSQIVDPSQRSSSGYNFLEEKFPYRLPEVSSVKGQETSDILHIHQSNYAMYLSIAMELTKNFPDFEEIYQITSLRFSYDMSNHEWRSKVVKLVSERLKDTKQSLDYDHGQEILGWLKANLASMRGLADLDEWLAVKTYIIKRDEDGYERFELEPLHPLRVLRRIQALRHNVKLEKDKDEPQLMFKAGAR